MQKKLILVITIVVMLALTACSLSEKAIVGTWKSQNTVFGIVTETTYVFNEDGTGTKTGTVETDFTYSISENTLIITSDILGIETTEEYTFEFKGSKLILSNDNESITLEK